MCQWAANCLNGFWCFHRYASHLPAVVIPANDNGIYFGAPLRATTLGPLSKRQSLPNSCGAAALLCAALELGVTMLPSANSATIPLAATDEIEHAIYRFTSGDTASELRAGSYSPPDRIVLCARRLGLEGRISARNTAFSGRIAPAMGVAVQESCGRHRIEIEDSDSLPFVDFNARRLAIVVAGSEQSLHYVMVRPDGSVMDPGTGQNRRFPQLSDTGVSVILSRP